MLSLPEEETQNSEPSSSSNSRAGVSPSLAVSNSSGPKETAETPELLLPDDGLEKLSRPSLIAVLSQERGPKGKKQIPKRT